MSKELLTISDVRQRLNCATSTIYRWMEKDEFPRPLKLGGLVRWRNEDLEEFCANAVQRRNDAGLRPVNVRRGRKTHSLNRPRKKK